MNEEKEPLKNTPFSAPASLIEAVDKAAEQLMLGSRSAYIRIAIIEKMARDKNQVTAVASQELEY